jgi:hypothetical protein
VLTQSTKLQLQGKDPYLYNPGMSYAAYAYEAQARIIEDKFYLASGLTKNPVDHYNLNGGFLGSMNPYGGSGGLY